MATGYEEAGNLDREMDETIRATLADINSRAEPEARIPAGESPAPEAQAAEPQEPAAAEPSRDKEGKFIKGEQKRHAPVKTAPPRTAPAPPAAAPGVPPSSAPAPPAAAAEPGEPAPALKFGAVEVDLKRPPSSWKPAAKAQWNALPDGIRQEIYRRETDFSNSVLNGPMKQNADFGNAVRQSIEPYRGLIEAEGGTPEKAIADTMRTAALFRTGTPQAKLQAIFQIDQQFCGGALNQHFLHRVEEEVARRTGGNPQIGQPGPQPAVIQQANDPRYDALAQQFNQISTSLQAQERERQMREEAAANGATDTFLNSKNERGEPKFPFVDNVIGDLSDRVASLRRANPAMAHDDVLQAAYDAAVWANPETRAVLIDQTRTEQAAAAQTAQRTATARRATTGAMPRRGAIPATDPALSLEDDIRKTAQELGMF